MKKLIDLSVLVGVGFILGVFIEPAYSEGFVSLKFVPASDFERQDVVHACGIEVDDSTRVERTRMNFYSATRVHEHCVFRQGQIHCPTFIHSENEGSCKAAIYTRGDFVATSFELDQTPRASDLLLSVISRSEDERYEIATFPYRIHAPEGFMIISEAEGFVEVEFRPEIFRSTGDALQLFDPDQ